MHLEPYLAIRERLDDLLRGTTGDQEVAACPSWSVRDVVAHMAGLCEDWVDGRLDRYASDSWTAGHVERAAGQSLDMILDRWSLVVERFARLDDDPSMGPPARWAFGDAVTHEADIRGTLGAGRVPDEAVALSLKGSIARWRDVLGATSLPTLLLRAPGLREWWIGTPDDPEAVVVEVPAYELFRALAGRRSEAQVQQWSWTVDPSPYLAAGLPYPFRFPDRDISD